MRILVIDDDDIARELLWTTLESAGHVLFQLPSAIGASRLISRERIDVVVVDVMLPDISGDKLARLLRENRHGNRLGIVLVSSRPIEELRILATAAKADAVVSKAKIRSELAPVVESAHNTRTRLSV